MGEDQDAGTDAMASGSLSMLPPSVISELLSRLGPRSLWNLGLSSTVWLEQIRSEELWQLKCDERQCGPFRLGCCKGYSHMCRTRCVGCNKSTLYVFKILGCRLCERCEHQHTKYSLVTLTEAVEKYDRCPSDLKGLTTVETCGKMMYLRSQVESSPCQGVVLSRRGSSSLARSSTTVKSQGEIDSSGSTDFEEEEEKGSDGDDANTQQSDDEDTNTQQLARRRSTCNGGGSDEEGEEEEEKSVLKAARKANKKQAKQAQRQKRQEKSAGIPTPGKRVQRSTGDKLCVSDFMQQGPASSGLFGSSPSSKGGSGLFGSSPSSRGGSISESRWSQPKGHQRDQKKLRHREAREAQVQQDRGGRKGGGRWMAGEEEAIPLEGMLGSSPKQKSGYMLEREKLLAAWGAFGISGLILATE